MSGNPDEPKPRSEHSQAKPGVLHEDNKSGIYYYTYIYTYTHNVEIYILMYINWKKLYVRLLKTVSQEMRPFDSSKTVVVL